MTLPATFSSATPGDAQRAAELKRVKAQATLVLAGTLTLFVVAKIFLHVHPAFGFVAAFAEAATIGGLADWYAVVALFRRPLGLPIPHTAIIQSNQHRIADKLGEFIEVHFLEAAPVEAKLRQVDFASFIAEGRHQGLLDDLLRAVHGALTQADTMTAIRAKIRDELPTLLKLYRADAFLVKKIIASATAFFDDVRNDPQHPFRGEFDRMMLTFVDRLSSDPSYADRIDALKRDLLARPELGDLTKNILSNMQSFLERSAAGETHVLQHHLANAFMAAASALAAD